MKDSILYKLNSITLNLIFCISIFIPFLIGIIEEDKDISKIEKRELSKFPEIPKNIEEIKKFPQLFDTYYSDHFGLRNWFTKYYKLVKYNIGDSPSEDVTIGKEEWLFLGSIAKDYKTWSDPIGDARGANLYSKKELESVAKYMTSLKSWLKKRGIKYIFIVAPNKHSIYFDKLPGYISKVNEQTATDQLFNYLKKYTDVPVVDLRSQLIGEKNKHQVYYKTDTHWNHYGANIAQYEIMLEIEKIFPKQLVPEKINLKSGTRGGGDLANFIGVQDFKELNPEPIFEDACLPIKKPINANEREIHTLTCETQEINAVIFRDSFFSALEPYFSRKFKRSTYIWEKVNYPSLSKYIDLEKPDLIIEEWVERDLPYVPALTQEFSYSRNKEVFDCSEDLIFSNEFTKLKFNDHIEIEKNTNKSKSIKLKATGIDSNITFPLVPFKSGNQYMVRIEMLSSIDSVLQLFYSDSREIGYPFSENNSVSMNIKSGTNNIYIPIVYDSIGKHLRLDPISSKGEVVIKKLEIKQVEKHPTRFCPRTK